MPELFFKGKESVYNHHLAVPHRPLVPQPERSIGTPALDGNLVIHGDNLHALKASLPLYAGKVDCIFIDLPYNTGNEGWCYNDNVNSPMIREWLSSNPVGIEDGLRHDKWLAIMWPRLRLLRELLSERGSIWITLDDNEIHRARSVLDEVFGEEHFIAICIWHKMDSPTNTAQFFSVDHDYVLGYARDIGELAVNLVPRTEEMLDRYKNPDKDSRGPWLVSDLDARNFYSKGVYSITTPSGREISGPPPGRYWTLSQEKLEKLDDDGRIWWGPDGDSEPSIKRFLSEVRDGVVPQTIWPWKVAGSTRHAKSDLTEIVGASISKQDVFVTPKPVKLIEGVLAVATQPDSLVLDSFAGAGTTGHAVLAANAKDSGNRRFILPAIEPLAALLFHTATNEVQPSRDATDPESVEGFHYLGASTAMHVWLIYEPDLAFLKSRDAALTLSRARAIAEAKPDKPNLVFAAARFVSQRILKDEHLNVEFAPLPFALYRVERT